jgi:hypothetical protein
LSRQAPSAALVRGAPSHRRNSQLNPPLGALAQGLEAYNGWTFWHVETAKGLISIDATCQGTCRDGG